MMTTAGSTLQISNNIVEYYLKAYKNALGRVQCIQRGYDKYHDHYHDCQKIIDIYSEFIEKLQLIDSDQKNPQTTTIIEVPATNFFGSGSRLFRFEYSNKTARYFDLAHIIDFSIAPRQAEFYVSITQTTPDSSSSDGVMSIPCSKEQAESFLNAWIAYKTKEETKLGR